jgi:hypothetical protein
MAKLNPFRSLFTALAELCTGRLRFPRRLVGHVLSLADGTHFVIFRHAERAPRRDQPATPGATFVVRFHVAGMTLRQNIWFSLLPMWLIVGLPGFRSKLWGYIQETGDFQGIYEWQTVSDADAYAHSVAMRFMTRRSVPGSVTWSITPACRVESFGV